MERGRTALLPSGGRAPVALAALLAGALLGVGAGAGRALADDPKPAKDKAAAEPALAGEITDGYDVVVKVTDFGVFEPASGLLSSGKPNRLKELRLWHGAHELLVDLSRVARIDVHQDEVDEKHDLVWVTVTLKTGESQKGKVERALELRGSVPFGKYKIRIDRAKRVVFGS